MPDLQMAIESAEVVQFAASPLLAFRLHLVNTPEEQVIHTVALRVQIQIEASRRKYDAAEQARLLDLFGEPDRWGQTLRSMLWTHTSVQIAAFETDRLVSLPVECSYDFNVAATKYFHALDSGDIPVTVLFSGTLFYEAPDGSLQISQIPWNRESSYRLPVSVWKEMMELHYPNSAWLCLHRETFEQLYNYKVRHGIPTWEQAIARALAGEKTSVEISEEVEA